MVRRSKSKKGSTEAKLLGALIAALLFFIVSEQTRLLVNQQALQ